MPVSKDSTMFFKHPENSIHHTYSIYADFETLVKVPPDLCSICSEILIGTIDENEKEKVIKTCKNSNHKISKIAKCEYCNLANLARKRKIKDACKKII